MFENYPKKGVFYRVSLEIYIPNNTKTTEKEKLPRLHLLKNAKAGSIRKLLLMLPPVLVK